MNPETVHQKQSKRQHTDYWLTKWHITGCLSRAVSELDRDHVQRV
jgi:hypothetical protein